LLDSGDRINLEQNKKSVTNFLSYTLIGEERDEKSSGVKNPDFSKKVSQINNHLTNR
jgi:hypothetical protein